MRVEKIKQTYRYNMNLSRFDSTQMLDIDCILCKTNSCSIENYKQNISFRKEFLKEMVKTGQVFQAIEHETCGFHIHIHSREGVVANENNKKPCVGNDRDGDCDDDCNDDGDGDDGDCDDDEEVFACSAAARFRSTAFKIFQDFDTPHTYFVDWETRTISL